MDHYQNWVNTPICRRIAKSLGLPTPIKLQRFNADRPLISGSVLLGATAEGACLDAVRAFLSDVNADVVQQDGGTGRDFVDDVGDFGAVVLDACDMGAHELSRVYDFFTPITKRLKPCAKIVIICRDGFNSVGEATAASALMGFVKSLAKEVGRGITVQLLKVKKGLEKHISDALAFLLSAKSAYVSGQPIHINHTPAHSSGVQGKTVVVTGAARGIGRAMCQVLARDGANVVAVDVHGALMDLQKLSAQSGARVLPLDVLDPVAAQKIMDALGRIDGIIHNAGITRDKTLAKMTQMQWSQVLDINLIAPMTITEQLLNHQGFNDGASIVCVSSISGIAGNRGQTNYSTSKAGLIGFTKSLMPLLPHGMTINAVAPGYIETKMTQNLPMMVQEMGRRLNVMAQGGLPVDVAETAVWLLGAKSMNANVVRVCGLSVLGA